MRPQACFRRASILLLGALPIILVVPSNAAERNVKSTRLAKLPSTVPAPRENATTPEKAALGKQLFFDPRLSGDNRMSCASCHLPEKAFADGLARANGRGGKTLARNTPGLLNVGFFERFFWDGRAKSLEEQALAPIQSPDEMNQDLGELETELNGVPGYVEQFQNVFGTKVDRHGIAKALAAFQRTLITKPSPFDRYLAGDKTALSPEAKQGMDLFQGDADCVRCHQGPLLSDQRFYRIGASFKDDGLGALTKKVEDKGKFRTPSLRNVARTAPYMHDGSKESLYDVVEFYYRGAPAAAPGMLAGAIAAVSGFGIGSLLTPLLSTQVETKLAVAAVSIPHLAATAFRFYLLRKHVDRQLLLSFGVMSAAGGLTGALLGAFAASPALTMVFSGLLMFTGMMGLTGLSQRLRFQGRAAWLAGFISGMLGGLVGNQGGIRSAAMLGFGVSRQAFVATATAVGVIVDGARMPVYLATQARAMAAMWPVLLAATVGTLIGTIAGERILRRIPEPIYRRVVSALVLALGVFMLLRSGR